MLASLSPERRRLLAAALAFVVALVLVAPRLVHRAGTSRSGAGAAAPPLRVARPARAAPRLVVDVAGAVRRPGLYRLAPGTRVADALAAAGGAAPRADVAAVNLAAPLADGEQVLVPARGAAGGAAGGAAAPAAGGPVDLNSASPEQLDALPGIGPSTAAKIVAYRQAHGPFRSLAELDAVPGIGAGRIAQLKGLVVPS
ncbi:MAG TPA: ComEA family DNA-binding protein [Gaiellaceae bacterium]|nr:ComEA family DNA-binding protein [Gaiellaceae bacterium]